MMKPMVAASLMVALAACASTGRQAPTTSLLRSQEPGNHPQEPLTLPTQETGEEKEWSFLIQPYLLGTNIDGEASVGRLSGAEVDVDFDDILETLELGGMIHARRASSSMTRSPTARCSGSGSTSDRPATSRFETAQAPDRLRVGREC